MDHPLVTRDGETFLTDEQLVRHIREKCGDEIGRYVEEKILYGESVQDVKKRIQDALEKLWDISITEIENSLNGAVSILEKVMEGERNA